MAKNKYGNMKYQLMRIAKANKARVVFCKSHRSDMGSQIFELTCENVDGLQLSFDWGYYVGSGDAEKQRVLTEFEKWCKQLPVKFQKHPELKKRKK